VVLCSILPAFDFPWHPGLEPAPKIDAINAWMKAYAAEKGYVYVDYHAALKDERDGLPANLSGDGVHPKPAGYAVMTPLAAAGTPAEPSAPVAGLPVTETPVIETAHIEPAAPAVAESAAPGPAAAKAAS